MDDDGEVVGEIRVKNANLDEIAEQYASSLAVIEATSNYYTIYDTLDEDLDVVGWHACPVRGLWKKMYRP